MATRAFFNAYHSYLETMEPLNDAERGRLFTACLTYSMTGEVQELRGNERFVFPGMRSQIDRDAGAYEAKCEVNRQNGAKGGSERKRTVANGSERKRTVANGGQGEGKGEGERKGDTPPKSPQGEDKQQDDRFDSFWQLYPKKKAKEDARKAWNKLKPDGELYTTIMRSLSLQKKSPDWTKDNGQYAPYPATWLRGRRWEDEAGVPPPKPELPQYEKIRPEVWRKRAAP